MRNNISLYGSLRTVEFHKGYFIDSLPKIKDRIGNLLIIWMDVDLASSARDVMTVLDKLDRRGAIFSHECLPQQFQNGHVLPLMESSGNVVPAIFDSFARAGRELTGRYIFGSTGAFWAKDQGIPVLEEAKLSELFAVL